VNLAILPGQIYSQMACRLEVMEADDLMVTYRHIYEAGGRTRHSETRVASTVTWHDYIRLGLLELEG
jgi:hypothetical protein